jgi:hypothetical protein
MKVLRQFEKLKMEFMGEKRVRTRGQSWGHAKNIAQRLRRKGLRVRTHLRSKNVFRPFRFFVFTSSNAANAVISRVILVCAIVLNPVLLSSLCFSRGLGFHSVVCAIHPIYSCGSCSCKASCGFQGLRSASRSLQYQCRIVVM